MNILGKAYNHKEFEDKIYQKWEEDGLFNPDGLKEAKIPFTISMPPPNATGILHVGHAMMLAIQDIVIRHKRMAGFRALWLPGTDHAAIATQAKVEKIILSQEKKTRHDLGRRELLKRIRAYVESSRDTIKNQVRKMGSSCDWSREAFTLDEVRTRAVNEVFVRMYRDGLIYRGKRIVNWCPRCHSTLADDEVEYREVDAKLYWIKYGPFVLATARPETKLGDTAVAVHPDDKRYQGMVGKKYMIPGVLGEFEITVVADRAVDPEFGSGAIKVTPAHSFIDNEIAGKNSLPLKQIINENGRMMKNCGKYAGMTTSEARKVVVEDLQAMGLIDHINESYKHNAALCYRCGSQIEPIPSKQWFIDVNKKITIKGNKYFKEGKSLKEASSEAVKSGEIKIIPDRFNKTYFQWMDNLRDWCVSRQIWYGHRIPVWYRGDEISVGEKDPAGEGWVQDEDTLDTWFSSGLWTLSTLGWPEDTDDLKAFHPTQLMETGYDIIFFWVARMIIMTTYAAGEIPFETVYLHGLVKDEKGRKMSKSLGNAIDPLEVCEKYSTDAVRLSLVIGTAPGNDLRLSDAKIAGYRNFVNKLWNISRYVILNYNLKSFSHEINKRGLAIPDKAILHEMRHLIVEVTTALNEYDFSRAGERLRDFTWNSLADWYLEVSKFENNKEKEAVLSKILEDLLKLWHPYIPFVTQAVWNNISKEKLMVSDWPRPDYYESLLEGVSASELHLWEKVKSIISAVRNARSEHKIEPGRKLGAVIHAGGLAEGLKSHEILIRKLRTGIDKLIILERGEKVEGAIHVISGEADIYLTGEIDIEKSEKKIQKEIGRTIEYLALLEKKLADGNFTQNAPKAIIEKEQSKLKAQKEKRERLERELADYKLNF